MPRNAGAPNGSSAADNLPEEIERKITLQAKPFFFQANGYPVTIERLADWARSLAERNLALAPVSAIADQQADR